ncbi:MAG: ABC transporter permease [Candidatus Methylomirabilia bacterium]
MVAAAALGTWEAGVRLGFVSPLFFPAPSSIVRTLIRLAAHGTLLADARATLTRVLVGCLLGGVPGFVLGLAMGWSRRLRYILDPLVAALHPIPKIALLPLLMIIFGTGETSRIVTVSIAAFFPMLVNTMSGVRQISPTYFEVAASYGAGARQVVWRVIVPGSLPAVLAGVRIAFNLALLVTVSVELVASRTGLGSVIWLSWETFRTENLYASLVLISAIGVGANLSMRLLARTLAGRRG